ncbi:uncharacterized protein B0I36DRAFT_320687 [Microdochium trichocladiopsis]|uniref:Uncharacterized protein n=1 Tax=Microdochium trichocladiopsis TaxID=1682393 RepID=A0A9P8Y8H8_9PEZI|nr:uncharacterized protein B0I36DRAFT_320687 [Microdochium trichocladiopsis]KAH7033062.1 hypothetical protein B0I36DRAFT_320687 [Microdochium trichocladiopsis]
MSLEAITLVLLSKLEELSPTTAAALADEDLQLFCDMAERLGFPLTICLDTTKTSNVAFCLAGKAKELLLQQHSSGLRRLIFDGAIETVIRARLGPENPDQRLQFLKAVEEGQKSMRVAETADEEGGTVDDATPDDGHAAEQEQGATAVGRMEVESTTPITQMVGPTVEQIRTKLPAKRPREVDLEDISSTDSSDGENTTEMPQKKKWKGDWQ